MSGWDDAYYAPHARIALERPVVLTGHPGSGVAQVGRAIAGLTGLAFNHVERSTEAVAGASRSRIALEQGLPRLRNLEGKALRKALARRPCGIVVMESALLEERRCRRWLRERATSVYLQRPFDALWRRIEADLGEMPGCFPEFLSGAPRTPEERRDVFAPRERWIAELDWILESGDRHATRIARELLDLLPDLDGATAPT